jgi:hypothetical protein
MYDGAREYRVTLPNSREQLVTFGDATQVAYLPQERRVFPCAVCGERGVYTIIGPAVPLDRIAPSACADSSHVVRVLTMVKHGPS